MTGKGKPLEGEKGAPGCTSANADGPPHFLRGQLTRTKMRIIRKFGGIPIVIIFIRIEQKII